MKATLKIGDGSITITGKEINLELDSDSTTRQIQAKTNLNYAKTAFYVAETLSDDEHPLTKTIIDVAQKTLLGKKEKSANKPEGGNGAEGQQQRQKPAIKKTAPKLNKKTNDNKK